MFLKDLDMTSHNIQMLLQSITDSEKNVDDLDDLIQRGVLALNGPDQASHQRFLPDIKTIYSELRTELAALGTKLPVEVTTKPVGKLVAATRATNPPLRAEIWHRLVRLDVYEETTVLTDDFTVSYFEFPQFDPFDPLSDVYFNFITAARRTYPVLVSFTDHSLAMRYRLALGV